MRRNYRRNRGFFGKLFKNPGTDSFVSIALFGFGGFAASKFAGNLIAKGIAHLASAPSAPAAPVTAAAPLAPSSGLGGPMDEMAAPIGSLIAAAIGIPLTMKFVEDEEKRNLLLTGQVLSALHSLAVAALGAISPNAKAVLSGDDTAVKLAAMYGMGGGTSIMPHYAPISGVRGVGEYLAQQGTGEYFQGTGEYFESGVEGLGNYVGNPELEQAAAGYGAAETTNTNHIDPSSDLDRELTIAEAAAGVGTTLYQAAAGMRGYGALPRYAAQAGVRQLQPYSAQAGLGEYFDSGVQGMGAVGIAPAANTWIPGMSDPQLWAGTRPIDQSQEATAMVPAGVLSSGGNAGVFG